MFVMVMGMMVVVREIPLASHRCFPIFYPLRCCVLDKFDELYRFLHDLRLVETSFGAVLQCSFNHYVTLPHQA